MQTKDIPDYLFSKLDLYSPLPPGIVPVSKMIRETSFFPGGVGLWNINGSNRTPQIMVMGQDFSTEDEHLQMLTGNSKDINSPTWKKLITLLEETGICPELCFFTNSMMGLRKNGNSVGKFIGFSDSDYMKKNDIFLKLQIETIKPKVILVMGKIAPIVMSRISNNLKQWRNFDSYLKIDADGSALISQVEIGSIKTTCVAIVHTSFRTQNVVHRKYKGKYGANAEQQLIFDALKIAKIRQ